METMSVHRALAELKNYNKRINKVINEIFVTANKKSNKKIAGMEIKDYESMIQSNFDTVTALIENAKRLKSAIVLSNASTKVIIAGEEYTVSEAIERKNMLATEKCFLENLKNQYSKMNTLVDQKNSLLPDALEKYLERVLGEKDKRSVDDIELHTKSFYEREEYDLIDPMNIKKYIDTYEQKINAFETNVDYILSESNATTFIEVDLCN